MIDEITNNSLIELISKKKRGYIHLDELRHASAGKSNDSFLSELDKAVEAGVIKEVKSSGVTFIGARRVSTKWRVTPEPVDIGSLSWLHPSLMQNGYFMKHPDKVLENKDALIKLGKWIDAGPHGDQLTRRERSLEIFGDEKALDVSGGIKSLALKLGMPWEQFGIMVAESTFEIVLGRGYYDKEGLKSILICENRDPWFRSAKLLTTGSEKIFNARIDAVIYGCGNDITAGNGYDLMTFLDTWRLLPASVEYWGDIDRAGLEIAARLTASSFLRQQGIKITPFLPGYRAMVTWASCHEVPVSDDNRAIGTDSGLTWLLDNDYFDVDEIALIKSAITEGLRIPQEAASIRNRWYET